MIQKTRKAKANILDLEPLTYRLLSLALCGLVLTSLALAGETTAGKGGRPIAPEYLDEANPVIRTYTQTLPAGTSIVSLGVATSTAPQELFGPSCLSVRRWDPVSKSYTTPAALEPGEACEVEMAASAQVTLSGTPVPSPRSTELVPGKNQVGNPFSIPVPWTEVRAVRNGVTKTMEKAVKAGWIGAATTLSGGTSKRVRFGKDALGAGEGCWLKVKKSGLSLRFEPRKSWTIMAYLDGDNGDMNTDFSNAFDLLAANGVGSDELVNLVAQFDRYPGDLRFGGWTIAHRFYVTPGMVPVEANAIKDWGDGRGGREVAMSDPETLRAFIQWAVKNYPADRTVLLVCDHGLGWQGLCTDDTSYGDAMSLKGFAGVIKSSPVHFDILGLDLCKMQTADVLNELQGAPVDIVVGSEAPGLAWPLWDDLRIPMEDHGVSAESWSRSMVSLYVEYNRSQHAEDMTLSAFDLPLYSAVTPAVRDLAEACLVQDLADEVPQRAQAAISAIDAARITAEHGSAYPETYGLSVYLPKGHQGYPPDIFKCCYTGEVTSFADDALWRHLLVPYYNPMGGTYLDGRFFNACKGLTEMDEGDYVDLYALLLNIVQP